MRTTWSLAAVALVLTSAAHGAHLTLDDAQSGVFREAIRMDNSIKAYFSAALGPDGTYLGDIGWSDDGIQFQGGDSVTFRANVDTTTGIGSVEFDVLLSDATLIGMRMDLTGHPPNSQSWAYSGGAYDYVAIQRDGIYNGGGPSTFYTHNIAPVNNSIPEPGTLWLGALAFGTGALARRKKTSK